MVLSWLDAREILSEKSLAKSATGWLESLPAFDAAILQRPPSYPPTPKKGTGSILEYWADCHRAREPANRLFAAMEMSLKASAVDKNSWSLNASEFAAWLDTQGETPSVHIQAWFKAYSVRSLSVRAGDVLADAQPKPKQRSQAQDEAIVQEIKRQQLDPLALPKNQPGKPGVKKSIRAALDGKGLFTGNTVFDRAWERLSSNGEIVIKG